MKLSHIPSLITVAFSVAAGSTLMAQAPTHDIDAVIATPARSAQPQPAVDYVSGGASTDDRAAMAGAAGAAGFDLRIAFSGQGGEYGVADGVRVLDENGGREWLSVADAGPWLLERLPPGRYVVEARFGQRVERRTVQAAPGAPVVQWHSAALSTR